MSNEYIYSGDQAILIPDGTIIWNDQSHNQSSLHYFDANGSVTNNSSINESYVTAVDSNETQYFSILEPSDTNDITLEDLHNLTVENEDASNVVVTKQITPKITADTVEESNEEDTAQVIVFTMDGSDDLYGVQLTHDEAGNIQKYQFKFRTTPDGQLEPIPETVTLLPSDDQTIQVAENNIQIGNEHFEETEPSQTQEYFLVQTPLASENCNEEIVKNNGQDEEVNIEHVYIKGETHAQEDLEETTETENVDSEILQHCIDEVSEDAQLETHLENLCIKTEMVANNIKQEEYLHPDDETGYEDVFHKSIPNNIIRKEETFVNIQQESQENYPDNEIQVYQHEDEPNIMEPMEDTQDESFMTSVVDQQSHEQLVQHYIKENSHIEVQYETELAAESSVEECEYSEAYDGQENHSEYAGDFLDQTAGNINHDSETRQYQIAENYAGEAEKAQESTVTYTTDVVERYREPIVQRSNILKHPLANSEKEDKSRKSLVNVKYYVVYPEKENVNCLAGDNTANAQMPVPKLTKSSTRSVLRTSFLRQDKRHKLASHSLPEGDLYHKRFAKNKDAMRAKHFHNFLNRTTIPHAPIRQQRQPRKQEIRPVIERSDEEIIVQEVMVSSNGFIESLNKKVKNKKALVTTVVELSDSEDDLGLNVKRNRKKSHNLLRTESELSIIEIHSDNEESDIAKSNQTNIVTTSTNSFKKKNRSKNSPVTLKRRRGRPPKNNKEYSGIPLADTELSLSKRNRTELGTIVPSCDNIVSITSATDTDKREIICLFCPKTFPSQNSLNTHIIHHNLENSLKNKVKMSLRPSLIPRQSLFPKLEYNHKCNECQETFKNAILLQKHNCTKKHPSLSCSVCLKQFRDNTSLNIHKKSHAKSNLVRNTSVMKISPKKMLHRPSTSLMKSTISKSSKNLVTKPFKCVECLKVCDSEEKLTTHTKTHKKFVCSSCFSTFSSKLLLDTHVRTNCVKVKAGNKRLSFTIKKSFLHTPPRRLSISKPKQKMFNNTLNQSVLAVKMECDKCTMKFSTFRLLYTHKVQKHGLDTPDKSLMTKPKQGIYKPKPAHGGIPANERMKKAYAALRKKLAENEDLMIQ